MVPTCLKTPEDSDHIIEPVTGPDDYIKQKSRRQCRTVFTPTNKSWLHRKVLG
ncbi:hypothetical protein CSKR_202423, partial [Clonorchis sinensis]